MQILRDVDPTPEQLPILQDVGPGFRLIRGAAGSGKTTAALMRLRQLCAARVVRKARLALADPVRVLVLTFNRTLRGYVQQLAFDQVGAGQDIHLTVETFSKWAMGLCAARREIIDRGSIRSLLLGAGFTSDLEYFVDEVEYALGRFPPARMEEYLSAARTGRGRAPAVPRAARARLLAEVIGPYAEEKKLRGLADWNDIAIEAAQAANRAYDVVVMDETQDLSANQIRAVLAQLNDDHTTTFVIDAVQRIYPRAFLWREVGIEIRPNHVFSLRRNHRNTAEIARFAASLVRDLPDDEDGTVPDPEECVRHGPLPEVVAGTYSAQIEHMLHVVEAALVEGETIAILQPRGGGWFNYLRRVLLERGVPFSELTRERDWPTGPEQVGLSTIHSSKGLEFDHVLLPGLNQEVTPHGTEEGDGTLESLRRLVAMGISRARQTVAVGYKAEDRSTLIDFFDPATYDLVEV